ncbi:MAG: RIP metalloprotease RseP [Alphaproteobacteria bacterium]|nr:RIP metalloprotease RseP [Alphaproteobacteria bacterium]
MHELFSVAQNYAFPFLVVISVIVFVHEFGHFWVARRCGIRIESFSIGFGPPLFGWTDKLGTRWQVACLPFGGYVKMFGDADPASTPDASVKTMTEEEKKVSFFHQSVGKRMAVVAAGPATNYLFAILVLAVLFVFQGQPFTPPVVSSLQANSVAAQAGLQPGDKIVSIDGVKIDRFEDIKREIGMNSGTPVHVVVERNGAAQTFTLTPEITVITDRFGSEHRIGRIGIVSDKLDHKKWPPLKAVGQATIETWHITSDTLKAVGQMIMGTRGGDEIGGPLRIAEMSGHVAKDGAWALVWFMAVISINLGLINLFPVPLLDGGHLMFYAFEKIAGHPLNEKAQEIGMRIGLTLVVSLMVFATWNDLVHLDVIAKIKALFS